jgi:hypothetical protein
MGTLQPAREAVRGGFFGLLLALEYRLGKVIQKELQPFQCRHVDRECRHAKNIRDLVPAWDDFLPTNVVISFYSCDCMAGLSRRGRIDPMIRPTALCEICNLKLVWVVGAPYKLGTCSQVSR